LGGEKEVGTGFSWSLHIFRNGMPLEGDPENRPSFRSPPPAPHYRWVSPPISVY